MNIVYSLRTQYLFCIMWVLRPNFIKCPSMTAAYYYDLCLFVGVTFKWHLVKKDEKFLKSRQPIGFLLGFYLEPELVLLLLRLFYKDQIRGLQASYKISLMKWNYWSNSLKDSREIVLFHISPKSILLLFLYLSKCCFEKWMIWLRSSSTKSFELRLINQVS